MEVKNTLLQGFKNITKTEKQCNSCGFVTFCLPVLYKHKYKCKGKLLGVAIKCGYCKRKFKFPFLLKQHKITCVRRTKRKRKLLLKLKQKSSKTNKAFKDKLTVSKQSTIVCPVCLNFFTSRDDYNAHEKNCSSSTKLKPKSFSARKSFSKTTSSYNKKVKTTEDFSDSDSSFISDSFIPEIIESLRKTYKSQTKRYMCINCRTKYPARSFLLKHLESNYRCILAHYEQGSYERQSHTARKTLQSVVARKSFPRRNHSYKSSKISRQFDGSARKSFQTSSRKQSFKSRLSSTSSLKNINQCPVCFEEFSDSFNFYQHQKKLNHWGKATKSISLNCKCPFCQKEFLSVRARNAHIHNHADKSEQTIESFIKSTTCDTCSQIFVSETLKMQHIMLEHSKQNHIATNKTDTFESDSSKYVSLPLIIKQQLKQFPFTCPICAKEFVSTHLRNKHFEENHLDSNLECKFCPIKCHNSEILEKHMTQFHYGQFKYKCFLCKLKFPTASQMTSHIKTHQSAKELQTTQLEDQQKSKLLESDKTPSQEKPQGYLCDICNVSFPKLQLLRRHEQSIQHRNTLVKNLDAVHESLSNLPPSPLPSPKPIEMPAVISCSECFEEFSDLKDFVPHRLSHFSEQGKYMNINEENTYICEICGEVSDSHSKVQLHLFWHLQVKNSSKDKNINSSKLSLVSNSSASNQHVAKKSFGKQSHDTHQEVMIGGIKKHLFTCEDCNIGFTNQAHYNMHVRRFCKMKNSSPNKNLKELSKTNSEKLPLERDSISIAKVDDDKSTEIQKEKEEINIDLCKLCFCMYTVAGKITHEEFCDKCKQTNLDMIFDSENMKNSMLCQNAVAGCLQCSCIFDTLELFSQHMISNHSQVEKNEILLNEVEKEILTIEGENVIHCQICNLIFFSTDVLGDHETVCQKFSYSNSKLENYTPDFKEVLEQNCIIANCLACNVAFNNPQDMAHHIVAHQENSEMHKDQEEPTAEESSKAIGDDKTDVKESILFQNEKMETDSNYQVLLNEEKSKVSNSLPNAHPESLTENNVSISSDIPLNSLQNNELESVIDKLRKNFSQLLSILVADNDLMQQLGYGELTVDEVLVNVLQTMEQTPVLKDESTSDLECLRKNIQILLDFCLEDQVMALIGDGKASTDDIVVEALKIFGGESSMSIVALE